MSRITCLFSALIVLGLSSSTLKANPPLRIGIIVHKDNVTPKLSEHDVRRIFLQEQKNWASGKEIRVLVYRRSSKISSLFAEKALERTEAELRRYWIKREITGGGRAPEKCRNERQMLQRVSRDPKAIGFASLTMIDAKKWKGKIKIVYLIE